MDIHTLGVEKNGYFVVQKYGYSMRIHPIETGFFSIDGGGMFGILPRKVWVSRYPVDGENRCPMGMRVFLADFGERKVLFDAGIGTTAVRGMEYYRFHDVVDLRAAFNHLGVEPEMVTDVVLSHLHFDHCGGAVVQDSSGRFVPAFPRAVYWVGSRQRELAFNPSAWEEDSYAPFVVETLEASGQLRLISADMELFPGLRVALFQGHTDDQLVSFIETAEGTYVFGGDVVPTALHVMKLCVSAMDNSALVALDQKMRLLHEVVDRNACLLFYHDTRTMAVRLKRINNNPAIKAILTTLP